MTYNLSTNVVRLYLGQKNNDDRAHYRSCSPNITIGSMLSTSVRSSNHDGGTRTLSTSVICPSIIYCPRFVFIYLFIDV